MLCIFYSGPAPHGCHKTAWDYICDTTVLQKSVFTVIMNILTFTYYFTLHTLETFDFDAYQAFPETVTFMF